ncbi:Fic family protein [Isoptericola sp. NEAU-Y5]|uniref:Fic family protein n=1 Tax=Isoptericola luteus TaxID=2879484 RepID=A0ABS7ZK88_9MICO|nr:Fic family protein [Isoptericola sp. NEAU-Y5]MCA5894937.1 Fic family protein [Isoptericola sp. NEAU-Y5]
MTTTDRHGNLRGDAGRPSGQASPSAADDLDAPAEPRHGWPALSHEDRDWTSTIEPGRLSVFERMRIERPYKAAVAPEIADLPVVLAAETTEIVEGATQDVVRFDEQMSSLPVPMPAVLLRSESASSSQIEHLTTNARNLAMASIGVDAKQNAALVAANVRAMTLAADAGADRVDAEAILAVHRALMMASEPDVAGRWRTEQVWIGSHTAYPHGADFIPPHHDRVVAAIHDLVRFAGRYDVPAIAHAAITHAQFETIHPFTEGNGRTGRVLLQSVLRRRGLLRATTVPVSAGLLGDPDRYFRALTAYRDGDVDRIVTEVAKAAMSATANGRELAAAIADIRARWHEQIKARSNSSAWPLSDSLFAQPVVTAEHVATTLGLSDRGARNTIDVLVRDGVLTPATTAKRKQYWQASEVLTAMDSFSRRAGRRA